MSYVKGQMSMETLIGIVFVLFILVLAAAYASQKTGEGDDIKLKADCTRIAQSFADNINNIAEQGHGFYKYFSLPEKAYGGNDYNISLYSTWVEINSNNYSYVTQTVTSNITIFCLDYGYTKRNKVFNENENIYIICDKPELRIVNNSLNPKRGYRNTEINISIEVMNFGPKESNAFSVSFNGTQIKNISSLAPEEKIVINYAYPAPPTPGYYTLNFTVDSGNTVNESIESNNHYNETIRIY